MVREAYEKTAPGDLRARIGKTPRLKGPGKHLAPHQIDPLQAPRAQQVLKRLRAVCLRLPEAHEQRQFGHPVWQAGKKSLALARMMASC